jgi:O-succinylhomoserine sulfhydrylase
LKSDKNYKLAKKQMSGGGTTIGFKVKGDKSKTFKVMNALRVIDISNNLGDSKSLITHPSSTTHRRLGAEIQAAMGITPNLVRLSVGLENIDDLIADLKQALK